MNKKKYNKLKTKTMINKINEEIAEQFGLNFDELLDDFLEDSYNEHRRGSTFFVQSIVEIDEENYPNIDKQLYGYWQTNEYIYSDDYGYDKTDIDTLTRVISKEKTIIEKYWEEVES